MHKITLYDLISRGSKWLGFFPARDSSKHSGFANFSTEETEKKREAKNLLFWGKRGSVARNVIKGRVEILETDEIMTVFPQGIFFNNR